MKVICETNGWLMAVDDEIDENESELIFEKCTIIKPKERGYLSMQTIGSWLNHVPYWTTPTKDYTKDEIDEMLRTFTELN